MTDHYTKNRRASRFVGKLVPQRLLGSLRRAYLTWEVANNRARREPAMEGLSIFIKEGDFVADLGANIGVYALELSRLVGAGGRVYSFEPILENFKILEGVARKSRLSNVQVSRAAIGTKSGRCEMVIPKVQGFSGLYIAHLIRAGDDGDIEVVDMFSLDDFLQRNEIARVDFIRADVAGAELEVIGGSRDTLTKLRPGLLLGVSRRNGDRVFTALKEYGYKPFLYTGRLEEAPEPFQPKSYLHFFLHPESRCWRLAEAAGALTTAGTTANL